MKQPVTQTEVNNTPLFMKMTPPPPLLLLPSLIPTDVWTEVALQMLDARDLMVLLDDEMMRTTTPQMASGARFIARRVLTAVELDWFDQQGIPVTLFAERRTRGVVQLAQALTVNSLLIRILHWKEDPIGCDKYCGGGEGFVWLVNGEPHRENDLPAIEYSNYRGTHRYDDATTADHASARQSTVKARVPSICASSPPPPLLPSSSSSSSGVAAAAAGRCSLMLAK